MGFAGKPIFKGFGKYSVKVCFLRMRSRAVLKDIVGRLGDFGLKVKFTFLVLWKLCILGVLEGKVWFYWFFEVIEIVFLGFLLCILVALCEFMLFLGENILFDLKLIDKLAGVVEEFLRSKSKYHLQWFLFLVSKSWYFWWVIHKV